MRAVHLNARLKEEGGAVLIIVAAAMFALVFVTAFVVDTANWFEHKRHLQLQVDAAALGGADSISLPLTSCSSSAVNAAAHNYGGPDATNPNALYNAQIGGTTPSKMHILINSAAYWDPNNPGAVDNSGGAACDPAHNTFCPNSVGVDVKGTEASLPWFFGGSVVPKINAHARVCLMAETSSANALPIAVPNPKPKTAAAIFVDETTHNPIPIGTPPTYGVPLTECQNQPPPAPPTCPTLDTWTSAAANVTIKPTTGVFIALSGLPNLDLSQSTLSGICDQPLTTCFDAANDPPTAAVNFIRGWTNSGSGAQTNPPLLRDVQLFSNGSCSGPGDQYFEVITGNCSVAIEANVDAGGLSKGKMSIIAAGAGCPNQGCALSPDNSSNPTWAHCLALGGNGECWFGTIPISAGAAGGAQQLTIGWNESTGMVGTKDCSKGGGCNGTFTNPDGSTAVQQAYTGDNNPKDASKVNSGPLQLVEVLGCTGTPPALSCATPDANSLAIGSNWVAVTIGIQGSLHDAQSVSDPDAACTFPDGTFHQFACLKIVVSSGGSGSTQSIDCDNTTPVTKLQDQLANGCTPDYHTNPGTPGPWTPCPNKNALGDVNHPQPWECAALFTGAKIPEIGNGLNLRLYGIQNPLTCPAFGTNGHNNWDMYDPNAATDGNPNPTTDGFPPGDKRIVGVYLTAYGAFMHTSGTSLTIPITDFATFYITGYDQSPCTNPVDGHPDDPIPDKGTIVGHFIKYVDKLNSGGGTTACDPTSFGACVPVMTK